MQLIMDIFSRACLAFGLTINLKKTKVMYTPPIGQVYVEPKITVEGNRLGVVDSFVYLGSTLSRNGSLDAEISRRIAKASTALGKLEKRVWSDRGITTNTNLSIYEASVLTVLLYGSETWTTYKATCEPTRKFSSELHPQNPKHQMEIVHTRYRCP